MVIKTHQLFCQALILLVQCHFNCVDDQGVVVVTIAVVGVPDVIVGVVTIGSVGADVVEIVVGVAIAGRGVDVVTPRGKADVAIGVFVVI